MNNFERGCRLAAVSATCLAALVLPQAALANATVSGINTRLLNAVRTAPIPPPRMSRAIAMVNISVFDAVNAGSGLAYEGYSYGGPHISGSTDALAISAGYTMMANLFPTLSGSLTTEMNNQLNALTISAAVRATSKAFGQSVANNFFNARLTDGASVAQVPYTPGTDLGDFQPIGGNPPVLPLWGNVTTFAATSATQFSPGAPPAVGSPEWIADYESVRLLGCATCGTPEQQTIAKFWADGGGTFTPPGHWLNITNGLLTALPILEAARLSALVGMAVADAGITSWNIKYDYETMRPITAINTCTVGTCGVAGEPGWVPLLGTPNFPSYTSGHSTFSGAGAGAIAGFFGTDDKAFCTSGDPLSGVIGVRCYTSLSQAATEAGDSRIFGGIHFEHDNARAVTKGIELGQHVASTQLQFQGAVPEPSSWAMLIAGFGLIGATLRRRRAVAIAA